MFKAPQGYWEIVPFDYSLSSDQRIEILDRWTVEQFLRDYKYDFGVMAQLRAVLNRTDPVGRLTDDEVITTVVARLISYDLMLRRKPWRRRAVDAGPQEQQDQAPSAPAQAPVAPPPSQVEEPEPNTFGTGSDGQAQAAALESAAASGVPFCEECEKARQQAA